MSEEIAGRGYLLDAHTALWALERPETLSDAALEAIGSGPNVLSVVVYWEVMIKSMKGKLDVGAPRAWWLEALDQLAATVLPIRPDHVSAVHGLPSIHGDPFDRILVGQAIAERLSLVTSDSETVRYASKTLRVVA